MTSEDDLKKATKDAAARASQVGHETIGEARDTLDAAPSAAGDVIDRARAEAHGLVDALRNNPGDALGAIRTGGDGVARRVTRQPVEALLLACAIGYLAGWALNRV